MMLQKDTKDFYLADKYSLQQVEEEFGQQSSLEQEFNDLWDSTILEESIYSHADYGGEYAGSGTLDYIEAKVLYFWIRMNEPKLIIEIGTAQGVSASIICSAQEKNGHGNFITIDSKPAHLPCKSFLDWEEGGSVEVVIQDAIQYFSRYKGQEPDLIFLDADHRKPFCDTIITLFKNQFPNADYLYHEWSLSVNAGSPEINYVSRREWLFQFHERASFEKIMSHKEHYGFVGSCGIGLCI
jgi:cephalosporin hydroxylase